ncbi:MAG: asparagine synthase (glutamine-hydrolyzing) [Bacteroidota bacterium]|jgi:asparagine synthase (glutamine-hydrolysing)
MCGISVIIDTSGNRVSEAVIKPFNDIIAHRGPDDEGFYFDQNIALGHRRLSIIDLSKDGHQPMASGDDLVIIFNGEIYNYIELRKELTDAGYTFRTKTDTEVILNAYRHWGEDCLHKFNGMWAFVIYHRPSGEVFGARDRFGVKPFYFYQHQQYFCIASEIKQFTTLPGWQAKANVSRITDFLIYSISDHTAETMFADVFQLQGGYALRFNLAEKQPHIFRWYDIREKCAERPIPYAEACQQFRDKLRDAVKLRLRADVKIGSCLSGGLDSSCIVGLINDELKLSGLNHLQETVSACATDIRFDEQEFIDVIISEKQIVNHKLFPSFKVFTDKVAALTWHQDEPFGSTSIFAQWEVFNEAANHGLIVMLDGQGADESLAGYDQYYQVYLSQLLAQFNIISFLQLFPFVKKRLKVSSFKLLGIVAASLLPNGMAKKLRQKNNQNNHSYLRAEVWNHYHGFDFAIYRNVKAFSADMLGGLHVSKLLRYEDRNSMAHSIESRVPFLDFRFVEFIMSLPVSFIVHKDINKKVLRDSMKGIVPDKILERRDKKGFLTPETVWINENKEVWFNWLKEAEVVLAPIIKAGVANQFLKEVNKGDISMGSVYWKIISLSFWAKRFNVEFT